MISFLSLIMILIVYVIPTNILIFSLSKVISNNIINEVIDIFSNIINKVNIDYIDKIINFTIVNVRDILIWTIYIIIILILFIILKIILTLWNKINFVRNGTSLYEEINNFFERYDKGLKCINRVGRGIVITLLSIIIYFKVLDVKIFIFAILLLLFGFDKYKIKKVKKEKVEVEDNIYTDVETNINKSNGSNYLTLKWKYVIDPLGIEKPISFKAEFRKGDRDVVIDKFTGIEKQKSIDELSYQIKKACDYKELGNKHIISVVLALANSFNISDETDNIKLPSEVVESNIGSEEEIEKCVVAILASIGFDIEKHKISLSEGKSKLVLMVSGADNEKSDNYYIKDSKKYYYCEIFNDNGYYIGELKEQYSISK